MREKRVVIAGAGKIGRGYLAEVFQTGGYHITFLVHNPEQTQALRSQGSYIIFRGNREETGIEEVRIAGYDAYCTVTERQECLQAMMQAPYVLLPIYPAACADFGRMLAEVINERAVKNPEQTMDLILCVNFMRATQQLRQAILPWLNPEALPFFEQKVGISETLVNRLSVEPTEEMRKKDPLSLSAGYGEALCIDGDAIKGELPQSPWIDVRDHLPARFVYKIWNINMQHFAVALYGSYFGYRYVREATANPYVEQCVRHMAKQEAVRGIGYECGMSDEELERRLGADHWVTWTNPASNDSVARVVADMRRKLSKEDRVIGPALACLKGGKLPFFISRIAALAMLYENPQDATCVELHAILEREGVRGVLREFSGLSEADPQERQLMELIEDQYMALCR